MVWYVSAIIAEFATAENFIETSTSRYGKGFAKWKPNGSVAATSTANGLVSQNRHLARNRLSTLLVTMLSPKPVLQTFLPKPSNVHRLPKIRNDKDL